MSELTNRRDFFKGAGAAAASPLTLASETTEATHADGTPEQIHLTWGDDPSQTVFVSWASPAQAVNPRVILEHPGATPSMIHAIQRNYTDGVNGQTVFTYFHFAADRCQQQAFMAGIFGEQAFDQLQTEGNGAAD